MSDEDNDVGYGKPPTHSQWKKGQSGNPNGRPKKQKQSLYEVFEKELNRLVSVKEGECVTQATMQEVAIKRLLALCAQGNVAAMNLVHKMNKDMQKNAPPAAPPQMIIRPPAGPVVAQPPIYYKDKDKD